MSERIILGRLCRAREALGARQRDIAKLLGVPPQRVSDWETGLREPTPRQYQDLCRALVKMGAKRKLEELISGAEDILEELEEV